MILVRFFVSNNLIYIMDINELQKIIIKFCDDRDWKQFHNPKDLATAIAIEAWELQEHFLWKSQSDSYKIWNGTEEVNHELADIMIFLMQFAEECNIDIEKAVLEKLKISNKKYPVEKSKGKSDKYSKL